jgi:CRISPR/Cas system-associated endoribonuclease Cas2
MMMIFDANKASRKQRRNIFFCEVEEEDLKKLRSETKRMSEEKGIYG